MNTLGRKLFAHLILCFFCLVGTMVEAGEHSSSTGHSGKSWILSAGYGITHNGMGETKVDVETVDVVVGRETFLTENFGRGLFYGRHSLVVEVPLSFVVVPWEEPMIGLNFLARWTFESSEKTKPYVFAGGGPVYTNAKIKGLGSKVNGNYQYGLGVRFPSRIGDEFVIEYHFHHISNMNTKDPNDPLNSSKLLFGVRF